MVTVTLMTDEPVTHRPDQLTSAPYSHRLHPLPLQGVSGCVTSIRAAENHFLVAQLPTPGAPTALVVPRETLQQLYFTC